MDRHANGFRPLRSAPTIVGAKQSSYLSTRGVRKNCSWARRIINAVTRDTFNCVTTEAGHVDRSQE